MPIIFLLVAVVLAKVSANHEMSKLNCTEEFQTLLERAIKVKNYCNIQGFYDCCEVRNTHISCDKYFYIDSYNIIIVGSSNQKLLRIHTIDRLWVTHACDVHKRK